MKEVVIKISDAMYKYITMEHAICIKEVGEYLFGLVRCTGTLLPKGHGRLIDADVLGEKLNRYTEAPYPYALAVFNESPTIIEAYKAEGEE